MIDLALRFKHLAEVALALVPCQYRNKMIRVVEPFLKQRIKHCFPVKCFLDTLHWR